MTTTPARLTRVAAVLAVSAVALVGCAGSPDPEITTTTAPPVVAEPSATPTATATPTPDAAAPTCETLIPESLIEEFESHNWSYKQDVLRVGSIVLRDGIQCVWGDYSVASDNVQIFGWAPISESEAHDARAELLGSGWQRVDDDSAEYITENPETAVATHDGYGMTYQFGDGWLLFADTKQGLVLIERPQD